MVGCQPVYYEIAIAVIATPMVAFFLYLTHCCLNYYDQKKEVIWKLTLILTIFWVMLVLQPLSECWIPLELYGLLEFPSIHVMLEAVILAYISTELWDLWFADIELRKE